MHSLLGLGNMLSKFTWISIVKFNVKYFNVWDDGLVPVPSKVGNLYGGVHLLFRLGKSSRANCKFVATSLWS